MNDYIFDYSQYKKNINKKNSFNFSIIFLVIILLLGACVFLKPNNTKTKEFYFIEIASFPTYQNAIKLSQEINSSGGAGYIYFDSKYHVLASYYSSYENAETVFESLKNDYPNVCIFTLSISSFTNIKNLSSSQNSAIENIYKVSEDIIPQLEHLSNDYDLSNISFNELCIHIKNIKSSYDEAYSNFNANFKTNSKYNLAKDYLTTMQSSLSTLYSIDEQNFSATFRYEIINFTINFCQFLSCF